VVLRNGLLSHECTEDRDLNLLSWHVTWFRYIWTEVCPYVMNVIPFTVRICQIVCWLNATLVSSYIRLTNKVQVTINLSLCLTKHHDMKTYWESGAVAPRILNLGDRWRWVVSFTHPPVYPRRKNPRYHWIWGGVGLLASLDAVAKRKIPAGNRTPDHPARSLVTTPTELSRFRRFISR
jgi:hypothetical protein